MSQLKTLATTTNNNWVESKESGKRDQYQDFAREMNQLWNMKVIVIPIVNGDFRTVIKGLVQGLEDLEIRVGEYTIQTTALLI